MVEQRIMSVVSSSSNSCTKKYDVFISYRGKDKRRNFSTHLYEALVQKKVETYVDEDIEKGDEISAALMKAIEDSRVSIVVFSENFASSKWCLNELIKIMDYKKELGQIVIPVFYNTDPSHVRNQTGRFMESFVKHEGEPNCIKWKTALTQAANLAGWSSQNYRTDSELLKDIVKDVLEKLPPRCRNQCKGWVENLTRKAQLQAIAIEESAKCKAVEKVIKSLTSQLKDMAMRLHVLGSDETEWIEQDEPGVHIYLTSLVGLIYLKRLCLRYRMLYYIFTFFLAGEC
ncbi:disease resistance protein RLM3-like isoform X1 [Vigna unguiculata]|uniref:disease resistance protein RLM3-like isoform X1 n=2 Tax=Vigna unguiculata TaxID=3917 RepID=UPI0010171855|nr:disease resistance protein RLM3-like isoform X1 [Vigna unguiculata]